MGYPFFSGTNIITKLTSKDTQQHQMAFVPSRPLIRLPRPAPMPNTKITPKYVSDFCKISLSRVLKYAQEAAAFFAHLLHCAQPLLCGFTYTVYRILHRLSTREAKHFFPFTDISFTGVLFRRIRRVCARFLAFYHFFVIFRHIINSRMKISRN